MRIADMNMRGGYVTITSPSDSLQLPRQCELVAFQFACPTFFNHCFFHMPMGVLDVTADGKRDTNDQNKALQIYDITIDDVNDLDPDTWCIISGATFDRCYFPVKIFGRHNEIIYDLPEAVPVEEQVVMHGDRIIWTREEYDPHLDEKGKSVRNRVGYGTLSIKNA